MPVVAFRLDANSEIGIGHLSRCLSLADGFSSIGAECCFFIRDAPDVAVKAVIERGHSLVELKAKDGTKDSQHYKHSHWLSCSERDDAIEFLQKLLFFGFRADAVLVVADHYGIAEEWERTVSGIAPVLVVDDLADRPHSCAWLLDQTFGRQATDYLHLVPAECTLMMGCDFALLRKQFPEKREEALAIRRKAVNRARNKIMISMGGTDSAGQSLLALQALSYNRVACDIRVILGQRSPQKKAIVKSSWAETFSFSILENVSDMADQLMWADIAIGAGGVSTWERCCLGIPSVAICVAENQERILSNVEANGALVTVPPLTTGRSDLLCSEVLSLLADSKRYQAMSQSASSICDGRGVERVVKRMRGVFGG